jgi:hypothetical protein
VLLLLVDLWWFVAAYLGLSALLTGTTGEPGGVYVPGCLFSIAFFAILAWISVKVGRRVAANVRPSTEEFR